MTQPVLLHGEATGTFVMFTIDGPPQPKQRARKGRNRFTGKTHWYTPKQTVQYEDAVKRAAARLRRTSWPLDAKYEVTVRCYFANARRRDADNVLKSCMDACNGVLWHDDSQVMFTHTGKAIDPNAPRTEISVKVLPP